MGYQNTGTPKFYIDKTAYLYSTGIGVSDSGENCFGLGASNFSRFTGTGATDYINFNNHNNILRSESYNFVAVLGHTLASDITDGKLTDIRVGFTDGTFLGNAQEDGSGNSVNITSSHFEPDYDGFSIMPFEEFNLQHYGVWIQVTDSVGGDVSQIGRVALGTYYDMPHSPELSLTISHEYEGIKKQETTGGSTLSYVNYYKPPDWGNLQAWQLGGWDRKYSGRRVWDLSWNHLSDSDIEPYNYHIDSSSGYSSWKDNWFTNVIHYTNGGQLPFIFCPDPSIVYDDSTWTIPEFAICRFDMKTFKREQVANGIYNIKVKIKESW